MFHTFNYESSEPVGGNSLRSPPSTQKPLRKVNRSCFECTRRKIKCDGGQPCASCRSYKVAHACGYRHRSRRHAVSINDLQGVSQELEIHRAVLSTLFPSHNIDGLKGKAREQLLQLLTTSPADEQPADTEEDIDDSGQASENEEGPDRRWDEVQAGAHEPIKSSDDVNAVSLAYDQHRRSYLGVASISAILRTIFRLCPFAKAHVAQSATTWPNVLSETHRADQISATKAQDRRSIDGYFECIHGITPMLSENEFRSTWESGKRHDSSWLALLYMVCTMGSIASGDEHLHKLYHTQAQAHLSLETFASGNLESVQALCLLGGYYLQYQNSPNMATAILGGAHRMALALGLHRESKRANVAGISLNDSQPPGLVPNISRVEIRRRTWWSLICLDTWSSMTMGRPTSGRWEPSAMDVHLPEIVDETDLPALSLRASAEFCLIANRIQARLAQIGRTTITEMFAFDKELEDWHMNVPEVLRAPSSCPPQMLIARDFMNNRYMNLRLLLYRPLLLHRPNMRAAVQEMSQQDPTVQDKCHEIALKAIRSISTNWTTNRIHVWNATWYLFQAAMVPLLSIAQKTGDQAGSTPDDFPASIDTLRRVLDVFGEMAPWMRSADRSPHIVGAIFEALSSEEARLTPSTFDGDLSFFGWYDDQVTFGQEINWSAFLVDDESPSQGNWGGC